MASSDFYILTINAGSSSIKFSLFQVNNSLTQQLKGEIERIGLAETTFKVTSANAAENICQKMARLDYFSAIHFLMQWIETRKEKLVAIGHRVVHGGPTYSRPVKVTPSVFKDLHQFCLFDPEHLPNELLLINAFRQRFLDLPQIACFDTDFHRNLPRVAQILPIPRRYNLQGIRRYGFHGLSYAFLMQELARVAGKKFAQGRIILAHLGNGASLAAVYQGKSIDTSMSFTPSSGVPMSTRSGDLDPALAEYFTHQENMSLEQFTHMVHFESGLLGMSEISSDIRDLLACEASDIRAAEAISVFCYQIKKWIGGFAATLGGVDAIIFSGGIGEHQPAIRAKICEGLEFLGVTLDAQKNSINSDIISTEKNRVMVRVIKSDEEKMIAQAAFLELNKEVLV